MLDTDELHATLETCTPEQRVAFAAGCLNLLVGRFAGGGPGAESLSHDLLTDAVVLCWQSLGDRPGDTARLETLYSRALGIIEDNDEGQLLAGEHVLAGVCYALRCAEMRTSEYAVLVANNYYEAADFIAAMDCEEFDEAAILATPLVSSVLASIAKLLVKTQKLDIAQPARVASFREQVTATNFDQTHS